MPCISRLLWLLLLVSPFSGLGAEPLVFLTAEHPGLAESSADGKDAHGPLIDATRNIAARAGIAVRISFAPWARVLHTTEQENNTCAIGLRKRPANSAKFSWAGPIARQRQVLYARSDSTLLITDKTQLQGKRVAATRGSYSGRESETLGMILDEGLDVATNFRKLQAQRVDFVLTGETEANKHLSNISKPPVKAVYFFATDEHYLACNRALPAAILQKLHAASRAAAKAGELRELGIHPARP